MARPLEYPEVFTTRLPPGASHRFAAVLREGETQGAKARELILDFIAERETQTAQQERQ